jgi:carbon monoxide dehydrogenase subunit G
VQLEHSFTVPVGIDEAWKILLDIERVGPCMPGALIESVDGDDFTGTVKLKLGPINLTYKGKASFVDKDETAHRAVIDARGRDARGNGTAAAKVTATLVAAGSSTTVQVNTDLDITGKPAQFGRGVMVDVGNKLIGQFADALAGTLGAGPSTSPGAAEAADPPAAPAKKAARPRPRAAAAAGDTAPAEAPAEVPAEPGPAATASELGATSGPEAEAAIGETAEPARPAAEPEVRVEPQREVEPINLLESAGPAVAKRLAPVAVALVVVLAAARRRRGKRA